ncbi:glycosyltransferase family 4 protein [Kallotenue papyrolyticum]|uniref:glycosyltransferase family 4 protein n=1 Tax=Kallotenue papyrolyticum TaxID=1325125 RepID=UPI00047866EF|nr:glycosyltransferase family 4 protein [Kallotenue papyrolyticum]
MRVLYCIPSYAPGLLGNQIHADVMACWRAAGVASEVLTFAAGLRQPETLLIDGVPVHRLPLNRTPWEKAANRAVQPVLRYPYWMGALVRLRRFLLAQGRRFDLLHIETAFPLAALAVLSGAPLPPMAVTLQGADVMAEPEFDYGYARFAAVRALLRQVFRRAALLRADSPMIARLVVAMGADPAKTISVPFNITADRFPPADEPLERFRARARATICARHGLDPAVPILLSINRLHPFKGIEFLVEALPEIQRAVGPVHLLIGGPNRATPRFGDYGAYLQRRATELGVAGSVRLLGRIEPAETPLYYAAADIAGVVSVAESLSRVAAEAGAVGTPTIVTRTTGISEYVAAHDAGQVIEPRSGAAVAAAAIHLLRDRALWQRQSAHGPRLAALFRSEVIAQQLLEAYRALLGAASASGSS